MAVTLKTFEQFVGGMIRTIVAETPLNDVNTGSVLFTLIEAVASNDFENAAAILNVLELLNIDVLRNADLDNRAADYGLTRLVAVQASGLVNIIDSTITKISTSLYPIKPAPISGDLVINVNDASQWAQTGQLYIGRGTNSFEGPIPYTSVTNNVTFWTITLGSALQNNHLISDQVIDGQGTSDRLIAAGTVVLIPANNINPAVQYSVLRDAVIPAGESEVDGIEVLALVAGSIGNASINTITSFASLPFTGATVTNTSSFTNGSDIETDDELRNRIKAYPSTLARGTEAAILAAIDNLSDPVQNDQIESAVVTEPIAIGQPAIIYIDDGSGFQPTYEGQSVDNILINANGDEEFLQLANFPLPRPQVVNVATGPFSMVDGMVLRVTVDDTQETITFHTSDFLNISSATLPEIVTAINDQSTIFKARLTNESANLLIYTTAFDAEIIQVSSITANDIPSLWANTILEFPTNQFSSIKLYQNNVLLKEREKSATLVTAPFNTWNVLVASDLILSVDGTPAQDQTFNISDFGGSSFSALSLDQWVAVFNTKFAGVRATALSNGAMSISSNGTGSNSALNALGGTLLSKWFPAGDTSSVGQNSDFELNRENGNLRILTTIVRGDDITAGAADTKGAVYSEATLSGTYNLSIDTANRPAVLVVVADATNVTIRPVNLPLAGTITISSPSANVMRIMSSSVNTFLGVFATTYDYVYISNRGDVDGTGSGTWLDVKNCGLFKVIAKGSHTNPGVDTYVDVLNPQTVVGSYTVQDGADIQAFYSDKYPQIWNGASTSNPPAATIQNIVDSINADIINVDTSIFKTNSIKLTSSTESGGSIAIPVAVGNMIGLFATGQSELTGNPSHVANRTQSQDDFTWFRSTPPVGGTLNPTAVWLGRYTYTDERGQLTADAIPGIEGVAPYSEILTSAGLLNTSKLVYDDIINFTKGNNKGLYRSIRQILAGDRVGTQFDLPTTSLNHIQSYDEIEIVESLQFSANDSLVVIVDNNPVDNTIDIAMARTGQVNSGNQAPDPGAGSFVPTANAFSANDADNEPGIDFGSPQVWGTTLNGTNFNDYRAWFRARNWYVTGGVGNFNTGGALLLRATQYGPIGDNLRFAIDYPTLPNTAPTSVYENDPFWTQVTYLFGSGTARNVPITPGTTFLVTNVSGDVYRLGSFTPAISLATVQPGDVISILPNAGVSANNSGQFSILAVNSGAGTLDIYNPNATPTAVAQPEIVTITTGPDVVGTNSSFAVNVVADIAGSLNGTYFLLADQNGSVAFWFDETGTTPEPSGAIAANRSIRILSVQSGDVASVVASKVATAIANDSAFSAGIAGTVVSVNIIQNGPYVMPGVVNPPVGGPQLNTAATYGILANSAITNSVGTSVVNGNLGLYPGTSVTGAFTVHGATNVANAAANQAQLDALAAYTAANSHSSTNLGYNALDGHTVTAGYYTFPAGDVHLAQSGAGNFTISGSATDVFVFQVPSTLTTGAGGVPTITLTGGALSSNVYWIVGSSATINSANAGIFRGTIIANASITDTLGGTVDGRLIALGAAITLSQATTVTVPGGLTQTNGTAGFTEVQNSIGTSGTSLDGKYFTLEDAAGSVTFWFQIGNDGTERPLDGADRAVPIITVNAGDNANTVAIRIQQAITTDGNFTASATGDVVTVTDLANAARPLPSAGTSGFALAVTQVGSNGNPEAIVISTSVTIFPLTGTATSGIATVVNGNQAMEGLVAIGTGTDIKLATREEQVSVAFGHDPNPLNSLNAFVKFYDGTAWVMQFSNNNPNFTLKSPLQLVGVAPTVYQMDTAPNYDSASVGEMFKLIPTTVANLEHQLTQKALSQLPIVASVQIADNFREVQIKSLQVGSAGAVEVVGGRANSASFPIINSAQVDTALGENFLDVRVAAFPDALSTGDTVMLKNNTGVARLSRLSDTDSVDVVAVSGSVFEYRFNPKQLFLSQYVKFGITDVSSTYSRPAGTVWRWTHDDSGSLYTATDLTSGVVSPLVTAYTANGLGTPANLVDVSLSNGSVTPQKFELTVIGTPSQADYYTFQSASGATFAVWFSVDANLTVPTGSTYLAATNKIMVSVLSSFTENQIVGALASTLNGNAPFTAQFSGAQSSGVTLADVVPGDIVYAFGTLPGWAQGNKVTSTGDGNMSGFPVIAVNDGSMYFDVVNPNGVAMSSTVIGSGGTVQVTPPAIIKWTLSHASKISVAQIVVSGGVATITTTGEHRLNVGATFDLFDSAVVPTVPGSGVGTVATVISINQFTFATSTANGTYFGGAILDTTKQVTRYRIESLGFNSLYRLVYVDGAAPRFADNGVAVDDILLLNGNTFDSRDTGSFRIRAVDNTTLIYQDTGATEQINTNNVPFNNTNTSVTWTSSINTVTGVAGSFENLVLGDSVKKAEDSDSLYLQVTGFFVGLTPSTAAAATSITLDAVYGGVSGLSLGSSFNMHDDVNKGVYLQAASDITIIEGDSMRDNDSLFIASISDPNWFTINNTGTFVIQSVGTSADYRPYIRVNNTAGTANSDRLMEVDVAGLVVTEGLGNEFSSVRQINHIAIDAFNSKQRVVYLTPADRAYKFSQSNNSLLNAMGKLNYSTDVVSGIDGYLYYTGLLKRTQNTIDGFEPDSDTFPGYRAIGAPIELLPPLIRNIVISISVVTNNGVNLSDITNEIQSAIINYVNGLGVGNDVILSAIIAAVMGIKGVQSCTFTTPTPSTVFIPIADIERAYIQVSDISIS